MVRGVVSWAERQAEPKIHEIQTLGWERDADVRALLGRLAAQVQPIMRKRAWRVPLLSEFYPPTPNLLGLNVGGGDGETQEVRVRVRHPQHKATFLPESSILGTLLHELVHNVRGPHDALFYKLLDEVTAECEELLASGISGDGHGFGGPSAGRLGSHAAVPTHNPPESRMRDAVLCAAEARAKRARLMSHGPHRLGGGGGWQAWRELTPGQAAAAAAERRAADDVWCPCRGGAGSHVQGGGTSGVRGPQRRRARQAAAGRAGQPPVVVIDLTCDEDTDVREAHALASARAASAPSGAPILVCLDDG